VDRPPDRDGIAAPSFVPPPEIRSLRLLTRHISDLTADRTRYRQRLEKLLEDALCKLSAVVSALAGHQSARAVIEAMIAGERDPLVLAALGRGKMRDDRLPVLAEALTGMRFGPQHAEIGRVPAARHRPPGRRDQDGARAGDRALGHDPRVLGRRHRRHHRPGRGPRAEVVISWSEPGLVHRWLRLAQLPPWRRRAT
jgi:hypothetical protein